MTPRDLRIKADRQSRSLAAWTAKAIERIDAKFADASAHAAKAVTDTLKATPDGRPTIRKAIRSPSYAAALNRLDELWTELTGPSPRSLVGLIRDAREAFYRESFAEWKPFIPVELRVTPDPEPTAANIRLIRGAVLHGMDLRTEIGGPIISADRDLGAAVALAGRQAATSRHSADAIRTWATKARDAVVRSVATALSDSQIDADVEAGRDMIRDEHLDHRPVPIGR